MMIHYNRTHFYNENYIHKSITIWILIASIPQFPLAIISWIIPIPWFSPIINVLIWSSIIRKVYTFLHAPLSCAWNPWWNAQLAIIDFFFYFSGSTCSKFVCTSLLECKKRGANNWHRLGMFGSIDLSMIGN